MFKGKVAVITGAAQGIGLCIAEEFRKSGATVCVIDKQENPGYVGDIASEATLRDFAAQVVREHGRVDYLVNNAMPLMKGLDDCSWEDFNYAL